MTPFPDLAPAAPEIFLAISALVLLMLGVFRGDASTRLISYLTVGILLVALIYLWRVGALDWGAQYQRHRTAVASRGKDQDVFAA